MSISHYSYKYGHGSKEFSLESDRVIKEVTVAKMPLLEDVKAAILDAVYHPIGSAPINELVKPGQKIAFICNDPTRVANSFVFMPILVNEMNKLGIKDEDMHIVFALGTHRNMTHEEMVEAVGAEVAGRLKMYNSDAKVSEDFEYFGDTSRGTPVWLNKHICHVDHVIMTGTIVHHYFSGYGGGRKAILPGVAAMETANSSIRSTVSRSRRRQIWLSPAAAVIPRISMYISCRKQWIMLGVLCVKAG